MKEKDYINKCQVRWRASRRAKNKRERKREKIEDGNIICCKHPVEERYINMIYTFKNNIKHKNQQYEQMQMANTVRNTGLFILLFNVTSRCLIAVTFETGLHQCY